MTGHCHSRAAGCVSDHLFEGGEDGTVCFSMEVCFSMDFRWNQTWPPSPTLCAMEPEMATVSAADPRDGTKNGRRLRACLDPLCSCCVNCEGKTQRISHPLRRLIATIYAGRSSGCSAI
jgi:hypothetical protein